MARGESAGRGRREEVLLAAAKVFSANGYRASTIQDVSRELGFTSAALYYYFDSKEVILNELIMRPMRMLIAEARNVEEQEADNCLAKVRCLIHRHVELLLNEYELFSIFLRERLELSAEAAEELRELEVDYYRRTKKLIEDCVASGEVEVRSTNLAALALIGMMNWVLRWYDREGSLTPGEIAESFFEIFNGGVVAPALRAENLFR